MDIKNCLYALSSKQFSNLIKYNLKIENWMVKAGNIKDRLNFIEDKKYFETLKKQAKEKNIHAKNLEILSWLDTMNLLHHSLTEVKEHILNDLVIIQEYQFPFSKKRADYLLVYQNKILIIEFSFDKLGDEYSYETKLTQAINYKELLTNILPNYIEIGTYTFLINPEIDEFGNELKIKNKYTNRYEGTNWEKITELASHVNFFFNKEIESALHELERLDYKMDITNSDFTEF